MLILLILGIANITYILSLASATDEILGDDERVFPDYLPIEWMNSIIYTFITGMGEFDTDGLDGDHKWFLWGIFFFTTFVL